MKLKKPRKTSSTLLTFYDYIFIALVDGIKLLLHVEPLWLDLFLCKLRIVYLFIVYYMDLRQSIQLKISTSLTKMINLYYIALGQVNSLV